METKWIQENREYLADEGTLPKIHISAGNSKIGKIANISLVPIVMCCHNCACREGTCYALKAWRQYPGTRSAWSDNTELFERNPEMYFGLINAYIKKHSIKFFRWHVAGDIADQSYLQSMAKIARNNPGTKFLAFTKMHNLNFSNLPKNLKIILSMWPKWGTMRKKMRRAWIIEGEKRLPAEYFKCTGYCETCLHCWNDNKIDVAFNIH